ncbi:MAG TPA: glycosyltransferase family A protein [Agriterribacter sp.]|nr:glycosyltransferase family A protein [Agriterribacter sp.]HRQ48888.1 glycosyltransferase family A protein [Agriterribacter sp.]
MLSVVIPLYNKEKSIKNTVRSVLAQTVADFELLVINDGSTDTSREMVAGIQDSRIRIVDKPNGGISSTRNEGIALARYDYIAFIDADDYWEPDFLETIQGLISDYPEAGCYTTGYACKFNKAILNVFAVKERGLVKDFFKQVYKGPVMHASSVCIQKNVFKQVGYFNTSISRAEDYDMWARIARRVDIAASPEVKVHYMLDSENRAMRLVHPPEQVWLYYIPRESMQDKDQQKYYTRFLHRQVLEYLLKGKFKWAWQIASRNREVAGWHTYLYLPANIQSRQIGSLVKLITKRITKK